MIRHEKNSFDDSRIPKVGPIGLGRNLLCSQTMKVTFNGTFERQRVCITKDHDKVDAVINHAQCVSNCSVSGCYISQHLANKI